MSSITVLSKERANLIITPYKEKIREEFMDATAKVFQRDPQDIIVDFQTYGQPEPKNAPDILFRAETSPYRKELLRPWGESLSQRWHKLVKEWQIPITPNMKIRAKPYVSDSEWIVV